jgi:hypothetical protein
MEIRCKDEAMKGVLEAAAEGDLETLSQVSPAFVQKARCSSGKLRRVPAYGSKTFNILFTPWLCCTIIPPNLGHVYVCTFSNQ